MFGSHNHFGGNMEFTPEEQKVYDKALVELMTLKGAEGPDLASLREINCGSEIKISQMESVLTDDSRILRFAKKAERLFDRE